MLRYPGQGFLNLNFWMKKQVWDSESLDLGTFMLPIAGAKKFTPESKFQAFFCWLPTTQKKGTLTKTNIAPENGWLEDSFPFGMASWQVLY